MPDKLQEMYDEAMKDDLDSTFVIFQRGVTAGAVSMRARAMELVPTSAQYDDLKNAIGSLPDIG